MTYSDKVKASQIIVNAINALGNDEHIVVTYGTDYDNQPKRYRIRCSIYKNSKPSYSIYKDDVWSIDGMNFSEIAKTTAKAYTFDMMNQRSTYTFPLYEMELIEQPFLPQDHDHKF